MKPRRKYYELIMLAGVIVNIFIFVSLSKRLNTYIAVVVAPDTSVVGQ
jgi:hypothetical protein